ncbi:hypothetical protein ACPUEN_05695 [Algoriphagus yeomjeoni]|uniref:hypothetical protein n=1 Tax=Algoriphagus yeomjeoni TaxID=291403 RepID=UPI003CE5BDCF
MKTLVLKSSLFSLIFFTLLSICLAQEKSPTHLGVFYPISTHGTKAEEYTNNFSLHVLTGLSGGENGAAIYGLAGMVKGDVNGAQISGLWNHVSGNVTGFQAAGILNQSEDATQGAQFSGIANINQGNSAFQAAGIFNLAKDVDGAQFAGITNIADTLSGIQAAGISSLSKSVNGLQIGGITTISQNIDGGQIAGIATVAKTVKGIQIAGISNVAEQVDGLQIAGLVNQARKVNGMQIGLINIADSSDVTIGLVNIVKNGDHRLGVSIDENFNSFLTFRSGGKRVYGIVGLGTNVEVKDLPFGFEVGLGLNLTESNHFRLDAEVVSKYLTDFEGNDFNKSSLQLLPALKISRGIHLFAGPSLSYMHSNELDTVDHTGLTIWDDHWNGNYHTVLLGFTAGLNVRF